MKMTVGHKLLFLFCIMTILFVGFTLYVIIDLKSLESIIRENMNSGELLVKIERSEKILTAVVISGIFIGSGILYFLRMLTLSIVKPIDSLVKAANEIANGDLSTEIKDITAGNEVGELAEDFNKMVKSLRALIGNVRDGVAQLNASSEEMAVSSAQIVTGSREQSSKSTQVAAASHELSATIVDVARNATEAANSAKEANNAAMLGSEIVDKSVESINSIANITKDTAQMMTNLGHLSNEVGKIIQVIEDIASQTNLLALNAAIEAARAGEQGRGFAVVADEVRKLAEKTTKATKEIGTTIKTIQEYTDSAVMSMQKEVTVVEEGVGYVRNAGAALKEIVSQVEEVSKLIQHIATASEQQTTAADQISADIEVVTNITGGAATGAQQIAQTSQNIASLASDLYANIGKFKLL
jgi:methyl-accepting chemotaxis protein